MIRLQGKIKKYEYNRKNSNYLPYHFTFCKNSSKLFFVYNKEKTRKKHTAAFSQKNFEKSTKNT